ncbi:MAG: phosphatidylglycerophosphatase A [Deferrisomatales bacterium]|nr:phosphatidylglycerophosphatase A [Deferrisomatales bacterium]
MSPSTCRLLASGLGAGRVPVAPGTAGTLAAVPLVWALAHLPPAVELLLLVVSLPAAAAVCDRAAKLDGRGDPGWIVLDEMVGFWVAVVLLPPRPLHLAAGFVLFRLFDIVKPPPAGWLDRNMKGGWGILLDDVAAGLWTRLVLGVILWFAAPGS